MPREDVASIFNFLILFEVAILLLLGRNSWFPSPRFSARSTTTRTRRRASSSRWSPNAHVLSRHRAALADAAVHRLAQWLLSFVYPFLVVFFLFALLLLVDQNRRFY